MKQKKTLLWLLMCGAFIPGLKAQSALATSGGNASGSGGSASYTMGQVAYISAKSSAAEVSEGVQQAFEIYSVGINNHPKINLSMTAHPNPTTDYLVLNIGGYALDEVEYEIYDLAGHQISKQKITTNETTIPMNSLANSTYLLKVMAKVDGIKNNIKTFKINKNQ